jgi:hypothetical protein
MEVFEDRRDEFEERILVYCNLQYTFLLFLVETKIFRRIPSQITIHVRFYQLQDYKIRFSHTFWLTFPTLFPNVPYVLT